MSQTVQINPWLSMWTEPRETIRSIVQTHPRYGVFWISASYVLQGIFFSMNYWSMGLSIPVDSLLVSALILAPILAFFWIFYYGWLLSFIGKRLGGHAPNSHLRAALAWSRLPMAISLVMWFLLLISNPDYVFIQYAGGASALFILLIQMILEIWSFILFIQAVREVQGFSFLKSLANIFLSGGIYFISLFIVGLICRYFLLI